MTAEYGYLNCPFYFSMLDQGRLIPVISGWLIQSAILSKKVIFSFENRKSGIFTDDRVPNVGNGLTLLQRYEKRQYRKSIYNPTMM